MTQLAAFLLSIAGTLAGRVLLSLGIGWISYAGFATVAAQIVTQVQTKIGGISADVLSVLALGGFTTAIGIVLGAFTAKAALSAISFLGKKTA
jgi:hypothetical protein